MTQIRLLAGSLLAPGARLYTAKDEGLYRTSDKSGAQRLKEAGFRVDEDERGLTIGLTGALVPALERMAPPADPEDDLYEGLERLKGRNFLPEEMNLLEEAVRRTEPGGERRPDFEKRLRQAAAAALRTGEGGGLLSLCRRIGTSRLGGIL